MVGIVLLKFAGRIQESCLKQANNGWKEKWERHGIVRVQDAGWGCECLQISGTNPRKARPWRMQEQCEQTYWVHW